MKSVKYVHWSIMGRWTGGDIDIVIAFLYWNERNGQIFVFRIFVTRRVINGDT